MSIAVAVRCCAASDLRCDVRGATAGGPMLLSEVPPVLLAESWRDFHDIADKGAGLDPDWKKKAYHGY